MLSYFIKLYNDAVPLDPSTVLMPQDQIMDSMLQDQSTDLTPPPISDSVETVLNIGDVDNIGGVDNTVSGDFAAVFRTPPLEETVNLTPRPGETVNLTPRPEETVNLTPPSGETVTIDMPEYGGSGVIIPEHRQNLPPGFAIVNWLWRIVDMTIHRFYSS